MQRFLKDLLEKIEAVDLANTLHVPDGEVEDGEKVVGILPDDMKRFYVVFSDSIDELTERVEDEQERLEELVAKPVSEFTPEDHTFAQQHVLARKKQEIVKDLFWLGVENAFPELTLVGSMGVRKDWQVVSCRRRVSPIEIVSMGLIRI